MVRSIVVVVFLTFPVLLDGYGMRTAVNRPGRYAVSMLQCTSDQFTTYSNYGSCPCGPVIICAGCSTGCCCPTNGQPAPTTYPPAPLPYPPYSGAAHQALLSTIITVVFLFCSS